MDPSLVALAVVIVWFVVMPVSAGIWWRFCEKSWLGPDESFWIGVAVVLVWPIALLFTLGYLITKLLRG